MASSSSKLAASSTPTAVPIPAKPDILPSYYGKNVIVAGVIDLVRLDICKQLLEKGVKNLGIITNVKDISVNEPEGITNLRMRYTDSIIMHASVDIMQRPIIETKILQMIEKFKSTGDDVITHFIICSAVLKDDKIQQIQDVEFFNVVNLTLVGIKLFSKIDPRLTDIVSGVPSVHTDIRTTLLGYGGVVVVLLPVDDRIPNTNFPAYSAKKHAISGFMISLSEEYIFDKFGVKFINICYKYSKKMQMVTPAAETTLTPDLSTSSGSSGDAFVVSTSDLSSISSSAMSSNNNSGSASSGASKKSKDTELIASLIGNNIHHTEVIWHVHDGEYGPLHFARYTP